MSLLRDLSELYNFDMNHFSTLRREAGVSVSELAGQLGLPDDAVGKWEAGDHEAPDHVIRSLNLLVSLKSSEPPKRSTSPMDSDDSAVQARFPLFADEPSEANKKMARTGAFTDNMKLPVHRWFRYSAGFSAQWIANLLNERRSKGNGELLFDPFVGSGTALVASKLCGVLSAGAEQHQFVHRIAGAKLNWKRDLLDLRAEADSIIQLARLADVAHVDVPDLLRRCYSPEAISRLFALKSAYAEISRCSGNADLLWLALTSILRECSGVGTAQWQYILPNKSKAKVLDPFVAFAKRIEMLCSDLTLVNRERTGQVEARLEQDDARQLRTFDDLRGRVTFVVTSPPYPNNYDYADATRLEMTFWGEVESWSDLHRVVRSGLVRSCSQHSAADRLDLPSILADPLLRPILPELRRVTEDLEQIRQTKGGKKTYHTMIAAYFADLARVWRALRPLCAPGADVCFVVGDSAPYGVHVPVERWLATLAAEANFEFVRFDKVRDRNLKWKNRKHQVPLKEGNLWLRA